MPEKKIGELLISNGLLTEEQLNQVLAIQQQSPEVPIGQIICQLGFMSTEDMSLALDSNKKRLRLGDILVKKNLIEETNLNDALALSNKHHIPLGKALLELRCIQEEQLAVAIATQYDLPFVRIDCCSIGPELGAFFSASFAEKHRILAVEKSDKAVTVAMAFPLSPMVLHELEGMIHRTITPVIAMESEISRAHSKVYNGQLRKQVSAPTEPFQMEVMMLEDFSVDEQRSKYVLDHNIDYLAKKIISTGVRLKASDIHLECTEHGTEIRYRLDGVLNEVDLGDDTQLILSHGRPLVSKIKILCDLDITERRRPQNGSFRIQLTSDDRPRTIDFRVSTLPTRYGENVVIRILDRKGSMSLMSLGYSPAICDELNALLAKPSGIFLVTGPTGSGKSSTLYAILDRLNHPGVKTVTVEDPIEYSMTGISQSEVNEDLGNTFATYLRTFLRQDPDNIMVGEIRDVETAMISIRASLTGHSVLSSLHTNDSTGVIPRLLDMGIDATLLSATIRCVLSQRLVRLNCQHCIQPYKPDSKLLSDFGLHADGSNQYMRGTGCTNCVKTGFSGRVPIVEMWVPSREDALLINRHADNAMLREFAFIRQNRPTMLEDGLAKVMKGVTTLEELARVIPFSQILEYQGKPKCNMLSGNAEAC